MPEAMIALAMSVSAVTAASLPAFIEGARGDFETIFLARV
jgi:hypothetical protein